MVESIFLLIRYFNFCNSHSKGKGPDISPDGAIVKSAHNSFSLSCSALVYMIIIQRIALPLQQQVSSTQFIGIICTVPHQQLRQFPGMEFLAKRSLRHTDPSRHNKQEEYLRPCFPVVSLNCLIQHLRKIRRAGAAGFMRL